MGVEQAAGLSTPSLNTVAGRPRYRVVKSNSGYDMSGAGRANDWLALKCFSARIEKPYYCLYYRISQLAEGDQRAEKPVVAPAR
jgi:hypothetical protein